MDINITVGYSVSMKWHHRTDFPDNSFKNQLVGTTVIAVPLILLVFALLSGLYIIEKQSRKTSLMQELVKQERAYLDITALAVEKDIVNMTKDLLTIKDFTETSVVGEEVGRLAQQYLSVAENYRVYDQIRYIDAEGNERVRINYADDKGVVVPASQLQNKKDRYYFQNSYQLEPNQVYISPLDLNIENGELEIPYKPMIRFATPVYDAAGESQGIVVLNYLAENVLGLIESVFRGYEANLSLVNQEGFFLIHDEDRSKEFGFMFEGGHRHKLSVVNSEIYERTGVTESGWYATSRGLFSYTRLYPFAGACSTCSEDNNPRTLLSNRSWLLITHIQQATIESQLASMNVLSPLLLVVISLTVFSLLLFLSYLLYHKKHEEKFIQFLAHYDQLTGCYNRGWGLQLLHNSLLKAQKKGNKAAVLFIDLDKFKSVNDTYGHKAGDAVLVESAKRIQEALRHDDITIRLGGDEFLVFLPSFADDKVPQEVATRLHTALQAPIRFGEVGIHIGSSIGIALYPKDGERVNALVSASDKAMYQAKTNKGVPFVLYSKDLV